MDDRRHFILSLDIDDVCRFDDLIVRDNRILIESIENDLTSFSEEKGISPVVCLDYLQIVNTENPLYKSDKQDMDLKTLRLLSIKDYTKNALLAVSSFNRESYRVDKIKSTSLFDFKESGSIEYSSIVVLSIFPISREFTIQREKFHGMEDA